MSDFRQINTVCLTLNRVQSIETNSDTHNNLPFLIYNTRFVFFSRHRRCHLVLCYAFIVYRFILFSVWLTNCEGGNFILTHVKLMSYMIFQLTLCLMKWNSVVTHTSCAWT